MPCWKHLILLSSISISSQETWREHRAVKDPFEDARQPQRIWENWDPEPVPFPHLTEQRKKDPMTLWPETPVNNPLPPLEVPDPNHQGLLKDIGGVNVGFGVGVGVPGNDPVNVGTSVGVGLGESGLAGGVPIGENIFPRRGEHHSLNDYDGNKQLILPDKASKYLQAVRKGSIRLLKYEQAKSLVGISGGVGVGRK